MQVLKRDGRLQAYQADKIALTLARASDEIEQPFTRGDVDYLTSQVTERIEQLSTDPVSALAVHKTVVSVLQDNGFDAIAQAYDAKRLNGGQN